MTEAEKKETLLKFYKIRKNSARVGYGFFDGFLGGRKAGPYEYGMNDVHAGTFHWDNGGFRGERKAGPYEIYMGDFTAGAVEQADFAIVGSGERDGADDGVDIRLLFPVLLW